jgi:tRNA(Met) C34 N-acetyltransferase TmcA
MVERLKEYVYGALHYGGAYDAIREIVKSHFLRSPNHRDAIPRKYEYALISKVLQVKSWDRVSHELGVDRLDLILKFREYIGKMRLKYVPNI